MDNPRLDAEILVAHGLGLGRLQLYLSFDKPLDEAERSKIRELVRARGEHVPVAYLVGEREFWSLAFHVDDRVLVPRPETEHLVEVALGALADVEAPAFVDVGTGSGCIAVALLTEIENARAVGTDVSAGALEVARRNATRHGVSERLALLEGDALEPLRGDPGWGRFDAVLSNPPYVLPDDPDVDEDVRLHEPKGAVFVSGDDPLEVARKIARQAKEALKPGGLLAFEVGYGQADAARAMLADLGCGDVATRKDLAGIDRVLSACMLREG